MAPIDFGVNGSKVKVTVIFSVKMVSDQNLRTLWPITLKLHMCIDYGLYKTPLIWGSKVNITMTLNAKNLKNAWAHDP